MMVGLLGTCLCNLKGASESEGQAPVTRIRVAGVEGVLCSCSVLLPLGVRIGISD
jgi:hypothetical protein